MSVILKSDGHMYVPMNENTMNENGLMFLLYAFLKFTTVPFFGPCRRPWTCWCSTPRS
jgi:hypothetical protein